MDDPQFDVIIPTYNNLHELQQCLKGFASVASPSFRILVCVDGSTDETVRTLSSATYPFPFLTLEHADRMRHGRNATRNLALPHLKAEFVLLLDSDAVPKQNLLEQHSVSLRAAPGVSQGIIEYTNRNDNLWARYTHTRGRYRLPDGRRLDFRLFNTGNVAMPTSWFTSLGGQDSAMTHYGGGDTEFAVRLTEKFHPDFLNNKRAVAISEMNKDLDTALAQMVEFGRYNLQYLRTRHPNRLDLYAMHLMGGRSIAACIYRSMFPDWGAVAARYLVDAAPMPIKLVLVRYLVLASIYAGFKTEGAVP